MSLSPPPPSSQKKISILLVDDSVVIRGAIARILESDPILDIVATAQNGSIAVEMARVKKPDVVILDIEMPVMDGLTALPEILKVSPKSKVVMCSTLTEKGADVTIKAMSLGAADAILKPTSATNAGADSPFKRDLLRLIRGLGGVHDRPALATGTTKIKTNDETFSLRNNPLDYKGKPSIIAIGSSTGGPQALFAVTKHLKNFDIPIVITQHMPATFTKILAEHIKQQSGITTYEATHGMKLENGCIYVAPGGKHMLFEKTGMDVKVKLDDGPQENFCKPAVDPMMRSLIDIYGNKILCVILTGMGSDGMLGAKALTEKGGRVIAQDKATSVVWGMPGAAAMAGICSAVLPLDQIGPWVVTANKK